MKNQNKPFAVSLVKASDKFYVSLNRDKSVCGFSSVAEGLASYEDMYNRNHRRSYEGSMSACINAMFFQPAVVLFDNANEFKKKLLPDDLDESDVRVVELSHVSGYMLGIEADKAKAARIWEKAAKPRLITEAGGVP
jgi:hypothetical protein